MTCALSRRSQGSTASRLSDPRRRPPHVDPGEVFGAITLRSSLLCDNRVSAIIVTTPIDLHDEVSNWLLDLNDVEWDRAVVVLDRLALLGSTARMPLSRALGEGLFELRFTLGTTARRITYRFTKDGRIVLLTTFRKQRQNERFEVARARKAAERSARRFP